MSEKLQDRKNNLVSLHREAIARADNYRLQARLATDSATRLSQQIAQINDQIRDARPTCLYQNKYQQPCQALASWKVQFPERLGHTGGFENYGTNDETPHTFACPDHLWRMADDESDQPTLITRVR